jgi:phospholipase/carboxylesterase
MAEDRELEDVVALLPPLLRSLETLSFVARHMHPPNFASVLRAAGTPETDLPRLREPLALWPERLAEPRGFLETAIDETLAAFSALRAAEGEAGDVGALYRAFRHIPRAHEALYPMARNIAPVSRYFLEPAVRGDAELQKRLMEAEPSESTGIGHLANEPGSRGGFSLYVPEYYTAEKAWPLVMALHGGSGNGRAFLYSWLRAARSHGAILVSPTSLDRTWDLHGGEGDTANLERILGVVRARWNIDPSRLLLTGMSDGGTFSYVTGLTATSPFTHLAPISASFHPVLVQMADEERLKGFPMHIAHGALDWMFDISVARMAQQHFTGAGALVTYREIADLSHTYPSELNPEILAWMDATRVDAARITQS